MLEIGNIEENRYEVREQRRLQEQIKDRAGICVEFTLPRNVVDQLGGSDL
jgi:hypothetical protein